MSNEGSAQVFTPATPTTPFPTNARIGPNAIIQTVAALKEQYGATRAAELLQQGGQGHLVDYLPTTMVEEREFRELVLLLTTQLGIPATSDMLYRSGQQTAHYLLQHRIPRPFQRLLKVLPKRPALRLLLFAISKHAWTFAGSGTFTYTLGKTPQLTIASGIASGGAVCGFYRGTFETLVQTLVAPPAQVEPTACQRDGDNRCIYAIRF